MDGQVPAEVVRERYGRLVEVVEEVTLAGNAALVGTPAEVLVAVGEGRKDEATGRMSGRARDGRLVHFTAGAAAEAIRPGDVVETTVTYGAPHHLMADGPLRSHRRTRAGDIWQAAREGASAGGAGGTGTRGVLLGLPTVGAPVPVPAEGCAAH
jgi:tRNA-2-methylthio-N6-dimethylallyladenosine synthase